MDLWRLIIANDRTPRNTLGRHATRMIGSLHVAERRLLELLDRYGASFVSQAAEELMDYSERRMRAEIAAIPDGELRVHRTASTTTASSTSPCKFHVTRDDRAATS